MFLALALLLTALLVVVVKNREVWFGADDEAVTDETSSVVAQSKVAKKVIVPPVAAAKATNHVSKNSTQSTAVNEDAAVVTTNRTVLPPLGIEVVAGDTHHTIHAANNSLKVEMLPKSSSTPESSAIVNAAERVQEASTQEPVTSETSGKPYPLLAQQMKVQGSVLLQVLIGADGAIRDLRVLSGPAILASAARDAVRQWRFKPYVQNGHAVETSANVTVNFTIRVSDKPNAAPVSTVALVTSGE